MCLDVKHFTSYFTKQPTHPRRVNKNKVGNQNNSLVKTKVKGHFTGIMFSWALTPLCRRRRRHRRHPTNPNPICCFVAQKSPPTSTTTSKPTYWKVHFAAVCSRAGRASPGIDLRGDCVNLAFAKGISRRDIHATGLQYFMISRASLSSTV